MSRKNRPTLKQQFTDFINRVAPFDGNPLIQKTEHLQVETDLFDSLLTNIDSSQLVNSPASLFSVDFSAFDLFNVNSSGSVDTNFVITVDNLGTGQLGRIDIIKKTNDVYSFSNASFAGVNNLNQVGLTAIQFYVLSVNNNLFVVSSLSIPKSDSFVQDNTNQLATSKAVFDLGGSIDSQKSNKVQGAFTVLTAPVVPDYTVDTTNAFFRKTDQNVVEFRGYVDVTQINPTPLVAILTVPAGSRLSYDTVVPVTTNAGSIKTGDLSSSNGNLIVLGSSGTQRHFIDQIRYSL